MAKNIAIAYSMKKKKKKGKVESDYSGGQKRGPEGYPKYQEQAQNEKGINKPVSGVTAFPGGKGTSRAGSYVKETYGGKPLFSGKDHPAKEEHRKVLKEMKEDKTDRRNLAEGGAVDCPNCGYSPGGQVANDTDMSADMKPNEFDELVLSGGLEADDDHDIVKRAMKKKYK